MKNRKGKKHKTLKSASPRTFKKKSSENFKYYLKFIIIFILLIIACYLVFKWTQYDAYRRVTHPSPGRWVRGEQVYSGSLNIALLRIEFEKADLQPEPNYNSEEIISFQPFCGAPGSAEANATRGFLGDGHISWLKNYDIQIKVHTGFPINVSDKEYKNTTKCALDKVRDVMRSKLNMSLISERIESGKFVEKPFTLPGFEGVLVMAAVICLSAMYMTKNRVTFRHH